MKFSIRIFFVYILVICIWNIYGEPLLKNGNNVALNGYDAVSYYREKLAVEGNKMISTKFANAIWYFRDSSNLNTFLKNPDKFIPEYGGFCAYGTRYGMLIESDPEVFALVDKKLYFVMDTGDRKKWKKDLLENIEKADKKWEKLKVKKDPKIHKREIELASE